MPPAAAPARTKTLRRGISVVKERSRAWALGQPVLFKRPTGTRELSAWGGASRFSSSARELDTGGWIQVCRQPQARAAAGDKATAFHPIGIPVTDRNLAN